MNKNIPVEAAGQFPESDYQGDPHLERDEAVGHLDDVDEAVEVVGGLGVVVINLSLCHERSGQIS